jgi:putative membrane protein
VTARARSLAAGRGTAGTGIQGWAAGGTRPTTLAGGVPLLLAAATVAAQVAFPHVATSSRDRLTVVTVLLFAAASLSHALVWRGPRFAAALLAVTAGGSLAVEAVGVATGVPFGHYAYADSLGWRLLGVPAVIGLAWTMMAYPALLVSRRIGPTHPWGPVVAGAALAAWDLFLDPQMVAAGHWAWSPSGPALLGIPLVNFLGWFATATAMMTLLWGRVPSTPADDRVPYALYLWTYAGSVLAHVVWFDLPGSALLGGVGMGAVVLVFLRAVLRGRREPRRGR